jgi:23S rRNA (cytosine1962-C5)-methyltransferase
MVETGVVRLKPGKERKVRNFYPWIQRGECRADGVEDGAVADLVDQDGKFLARGTYNSQSRFQFRVFDRQQRPIDESWFAERFAACVASRRHWFGLGRPETDAFRLIYSEADQVPGLIVDQYGDCLVVQVRSLGMEGLREHWLPALRVASGCASAFERSDMPGREEEGLGPVARPLWGEPPAVVEYQENGLRHLAPIQAGLKTGAYLDQRETRRRFGERVLPGQTVLDACCYTGGFALAAARAGATVYGVDIHQLAIETAREAARLNALEAVFTEANAFEFFESSALGPYDWIVLDPPAIAKTAEKRDSLKWAVWRLVHEALPALKPGGRLIVCGCTYQLGLTELLETCRLAGSDRGRRLTLEDVTYQDLDHPAPIHFPEALYLKCAWLRAD